MLSRLLPTLVPLLVGALLVWWLVRTPGHTHRRFPWLSAIVALLVLCCFALGVGGLAISIDLPSGAGLTPDPEAVGTTDLDPLAAQLSGFGFTPLPAPFRVAGGPRDVLVGFVAEEERSYATAFRSGTAPRRMLFQLFSVLSRDRGLLVTAAEVSRPFYPLAPGLLVQVFPNATSEELLTRHREAVRFLEGRELCCRAVSAKSFEADAGVATRLYRAGFDAAPVPFIVATFWNWARGARPQIGAITEQEAARAELARLGAGK